MMSDFHIRIEDRSIFLSNGVQEVLMMDSISAISLKLLDLLPLRIKSNSTSTLPLQSTTLAIGDIATRRAWTTWGLIALREFCKVRQSNDYWNGTGIKVDKVHVWSLSSIIPVNTISTTEYSLWNPNANLSEASHDRSACPRRARAISCSLSWDQSLEEYHVARSMFERHIG